MPAIDRPVIGEPVDGLLASPVRNLFGGLTYLAIVTLIATALYVGEGWSLGDAFYMVVITIFTVGYDEVRPINTFMLRAISIATIVFGCTGVIFLTGTVVQLISQNQLNQLLDLKRMNERIKSLSDHIVICGFGRIGAMLARDLAAVGAAFVVVERDDANIATARALGYLSIHADATDEDALRSAGILRARTVAVVIANDAANVFICLSARGLKPDLEIIARGDAPSTERKLLQAGANQVVLPTQIGAERIAELILYPETVSLVRSSKRLDALAKLLQPIGLNMAVVTAVAGSPAVGLSVSALEQQARSAFVVQINRQNEVVTQITQSMVIEANDGLVLLGRLIAVSEFFESR